MTSTPADTINDILHRGMQRARVYDWAGAVNHFRRALSIDPEHVEVRFRLGWALWNLADSNKPSIADMAMVVGSQLFGFNQTASDGRRKMSAYRQQIMDAIHYLNSVLERDEEHARALYYLAKCYNALDMRAEADAAANRASALEPGNSNYKSFADTLEQQGNKLREAAAPLRPTEHTPDPPLTFEPTSWDDLVLNPKTKKELRQMQLMLEKPDLAKDLGVQPPTGVLLKGPPGTGKTTIARVLASEAKCSFFSITPADINQMYVGESEKRVRELFDRARMNPPAIIFVDEIDALLPQRHGGTVSVHSDKVVYQFLQEMDGITANSRIFVVGATNRPDMLDQALMRGGRLSREIEIPLPNLDERLQLFKIVTRQANLAEDVNLMALAQSTEGYSGADIKALLNEAGLQALIRISEAEEGHPRTLTMADFEGALQNLG